MVCADFAARNEVGFYTPTFTSSHETMLTNYLSKVKMTISVTVSVAMTTSKNRKIRILSKEVSRTTQTGALIVLTNNILMNGGDLTTRSMSVIYITIDCLSYSAPIY
jgi:hypothetical protein